MPRQLGFERLAPHLTSGLFERGDAAILVRRAPDDARVDVHLAAEKEKVLDAAVAAYLADPAWTKA